MRLCNEINKHSKYPERILQFGEGNFLRAFTDWMVDRMNKESDFQSSIVVVQPLENGLVELLNEQDGLYTLYLNGIKDGETVKENTVIEAISRGVNPYKNYDGYMEIAKNPELRFVISNTTEAGIVLDKSDKLEDRPQSSFPGKLTALLYERYQHFKGSQDKGLIFIPCELIDKNGEKLKEIVLHFADAWGLEDSFKTWVEEANTFCNSLVDRIVPGYPKERIEEIRQELGYDDNLVVEAEPFHLWVIEGPSRIKEEFPTDKAGLNVLFVEDMTPYRTRKVRILNGAHTSMVPVAYLYGLATVKEAVEDTVVGRFIKDVIYEEIIPTLDLSNSELECFAKDVLDRFRNPFVKHLLMSIALNSMSKFETRVLPSILEYHNRKKVFPNRLVFSLAALIAFYKGERDGESIPLADSEDVLSKFGTLWKDYSGSKEQLKKIASTVLAEEKIWKMNLNEIHGFADAVTNYLIIIEEKGMKAALQEMVN